MENKRLEVGQLIKQTRIDAGLSQRDLAGKLGVAESTMHHYEKGKQNLTIDTLQKIAEAVGTKITVEFG
jgi:UDP-N-acetylglucosamine 1-carboxyvinyltransferase